jgi:hypothetical protein
MAEEMAGLAVECGALSDREGRESLDEDSCDPENETSPNMEISSTRGSAPGAVGVAAGALGLGMMTPLQHPGTEVGTVDEAGENHFDFFTAFAKASSISECLLTLDFPFGAVAFDGRNFSLAATFARLLAGLS